MANQKIQSQQDITTKVKRLRASGEKIVTTCGAFDILHVGHLHSFLEAKKHGDILVVCLNSDRSIKQYKSPTRPVNPQEARAELLAALECVDYVVIFDEPDPRHVLGLIKPDVHVKSRSGFKGVERETVEKNGGKIVLIDDIPGISTSEILKKARGAS